MPGVAEHGTRHAEKDSGERTAKREQTTDQDRKKGGPGRSDLSGPQPLQAHGKPADREVGAFRETRAGPGAREIALNLRGSQQVVAFVPACPPGLADKHDGCLPPGQDRKRRDEKFGYEYRPALFGVPTRDQAEYAYYNGYLVPVSGARGSYIPLLGGALAVGQLWPRTYPSYNLPDWQRGYYGFDDQREYHSADNVVYRIDPDTAAIEAVAALLTGSDFSVGSPMPGGYDVYNVPAVYQAQYADSSDALYRYADGRVYQVDPTTNLIAKAIDLVL